MQITCHVCGLAKEETEFYKRKSQNKGLANRLYDTPRRFCSWYCKSCKSEYDKTRRGQMWKDPAWAEQTRKRNVEKYLDNYQRHWASRQANRARRLGSSGFVSWKEWSEVLIAHNNKCHWCGVDLHVSFLTIDHVVPLGEGGAHARSNVVPACANCNNRRRWEQQVKYRDFHVDNHSALLAGTMNGERHDNDN